MYAEVISDTHINMAPYTDDQLNQMFPGTGKTGVPTLVLAGDIGDPDQASLHTAINLARKKYERVIYVPGNHEFKINEPSSKKTFAAVINWFQRLDDQWSNFHFFYRRNEVFDGVRVVGATGWTTAPRSTEWSKFIREEEKKDREFLEKTLLINRSTKEPTLVVTHYPSTLRVIEASFKDTIYQYDYGQDLEHLYRNPVKTWVFGHIHQKHDFTLPYDGGSLQIICNPYGYPNDMMGVTTPKPFRVLASA